MRKSLLVIFCLVRALVDAQNPAPPTVTGILYVCNGSTTTLTASGAAGATFAWYSAATGGNLLSSSATYTTPALTANKHYYAQQTVAGNTSSRYDASVLVAPIPANSSPTNVAASPAIICQGQSSNLSATVDASAGQYVYWYDASSGGNLLGSSTSGGNFTVSPMAATTYYAQSQAQIINQAFNYTGSVQTFTVPAGITSIQVDARGGRGGYDYEAFGTIQGLPGYGGRVQATMTVTPGEVLYIYVGQRGTGYDGTNNNTTAYNGGGTHYGGDINAGGGGGATDIRVNGQALINRVLVAGGGGGSGTVSPSGGGGGGLTGGNGDWDHNSGYNQTNSGGKGGSQAAGGAGGSDGGGQVAPAGSLGIGGNSGQGYVSSAASGGAGGGGYYGGGGGEDYAGGGGGSSYTDPTIFQNTLHTQGFQNDNGQLIISYSAPNCAASTRQPVTVTVNTTPTVSAGNNVITCAGTGVTLTATGADTYTWQPGNLTNSSIFVTPASTTTYTLTGKLNNGGCTNTSNVTVTVTSVSVSASQAICLNQSATLSASGADSYTWQPGNLTGSSVSVSPTNTTTYTVTGHNNSGCSTTAQTTVTVNPLPPVNIGSGTTVSAGTSVTLTATGADNYSWSSPYSANTASITFTPAATSTWSVRGSYSATGCSAIANALVTVTGLPSVSGITLVCPGSTTTLTASGTGPFTWYTVPAGGTAIYTGANFTTPPINASTTYYVSGNGSARTAVNVSTAATGAVSATPPAICAGSGAVLSSTVSGQTIYWYDALNGGNLLDSAVNGATYTVSPLSTTVYYAQMQTQPVTQAFNFTGGIQTFTVPAGVTSISIDARGGRGGYDYECCGVTQGNPGNGGRVQATMNVTPGQVLYINVGQRGYGYNGSNNSSTAYNGGGMHYGGVIDGGGGGGATDIRVNGQDLFSRVLVAGGGGGSGSITPAGGAGGGLIANDGGVTNDGYHDNNTGGKGGTQTAGGAAGTSMFNNVSQQATSGSLGQGGVEGFGGEANNASGGAGGGGYYGGGGALGYAAGGGGSSYTNPTLFQNVVHTQGYQNTDGQLIISYNSACVLRVPDTVIVHPLPVVKANASVNPVIHGNPVTLTGSGANSYLWNKGVQDGVAFTPVVSGTYTVTGTDVNNCSNKDSLLLAVLYTPLINSFSPTAAGNGGSITIKGNHFTGVTVVTLGNRPAKSFTVVSDSVITAVVGSGASGSVVVKNAAGQSALAGFIWCNAVTPSVSISSGAGIDVCYGTKVIFTAIPVNGGTPAYQWYKDSIQVGGNSNTYTDSTLRNRDNVWVVMTGNAYCAVVPDAVSKKIIIQKGSPGYYAYVTTGYQSKVDVVDITGNSLVASIAIGSGVGNVSVTPDGKKVYAVSGNTNTVSVINTATNAVDKTITGFSSPQGIAASPDGTKVYVANGDFSGTVMVIDATADTIITSQTVNTGHSATIWATITPDGKKLYVGSLQNNVISVINTADMSLLTPLSISSPWGIVVSPDGKTLYAASYSGNYVDAVDVAANTITATINVGANPIGLAVSPDNKTVYAANSTGQSISVINTNTNTVSNTVSLGSARPYGINVTPDGTKLIIADDEVSNVLTYNTATNVVDKSVHADEAPIGFGNFIKTTINACPLYTPSVTIASDAQNPVCAHTKVTLTATPVNAGVPLSFAWYKNRRVVGTNSNMYSDSVLKTGDSIWCIITSSADNLTAHTAKSNVIKFTVNPSVVPTLTVAANTASPICAGTAVTFTATTTNGGSNPQYQWRKNNLPVGINSNTYTDAALATGDSVVCVFTSSAPCASPQSIISKRIKFTVASSLPNRPSVITGPASVTAGQTNIVYSVKQSGSQTYNWSVPSGVSIVSGQGTATLTVNWGSLGGSISVTGNNVCGPSAARSLAVTVASALVAKSPGSQLISGNYIRVYPSPVINKVIVEFTSSMRNKVELQLLNAPGQVLQSRPSVTIKGLNTLSFDMTGYASGVYYIRLTDEEYGVRVLKVIKAN